MKSAIFISALVIYAVTLSHPALAAAGNWQEEMLFNPTSGQLETERSRDRIMIYQGLKDVQVAQAMDQQFDRIEHMMFTGTVVTDDLGQAAIDPNTGEAIVEADGC